MNARCFLVIFVFLFSACTFDSDSNNDLYNRIGTPPAEFPENKRPEARGEPSYYYRSGPTVPVSQEYQQVQPPQPQYQYAPQPYQVQNANYQNAAPHNYRAPASRYYSNPYEIPPSYAPRYATPYDSDQYYVPPSYYYNQEQQYRSSGTLQN